MRTLSIGMSLVLIVGMGAAQERVPAEQTQKLARWFQEYSKKITDSQVKLDVDPDKAFALQAGEHGAMIIPDKGLSEEAVAKISKKVTPFGQLWLKDLALVVGGKAIAKDRQRIVTVTVNDQDHPLPLHLLGLGKDSANTLELVVYAKGKEPVLKLPLQKVESKQDLPIEMAGKKLENDRGLITLNILGKYQAVLTVTRPE